VQSVAPYLLAARQSLTLIALAWLFELAGGAIADFTDTVIPKSQREATWTVAALHQWDMDVDDDRCVDAAEEVSKVLMQRSWI